MAKKLYFDYNASTPMHAEVIEVMMHCMNDHWHNPSTLYAEGKAAKGLIEAARREVAALINCSPEQLIFTSCGTESNNLVMHSIAELFKPRPNVITSNIEHDSVGRTLKELDEQTKIDLSVVPVDASTGLPSVDDVLAAIVPGQTKLISLMLANNETGAVMPIKEIVMAVRQKFGESILVHSDLCQAIGKLSVDVRDLGVDFASIAGHKFYGPKAGALFVRQLNSNSATANGDREVLLRPLLVGGGQERGFRAGTESTAALAGLGKAAQLQRLHLQKHLRELTRLTDRLVDGLYAVFEKAPIGFDQSRVRPLVFGRDICPNTPVLANTVNVAFQGPPWINSARLLALSPSLLATRGSACHMSTQDKNRVNGGPAGSRVLLNCGYSADLAASALRLSIGQRTTDAEVDQVCALIHSGVQRLVSSV